MNKLAIYICLVWVTSSNLFAQNPPFYFKMYGVGTNQIYNKFEEPYYNIKFSSVNGGVKTKIHNWYCDNNISYTRAQSFIPREDKVTQNLSFSQDNTAFGRYFSLTKRAKIYFNYGALVGISQRQKSVSLLSNNEYDVKYKYKLYLGMPLLVRLVLYGKKPFLIGANAFVHVQRYYEYGFGINIALGKYELEKLKTK